MNPSRCRVCHRHARGACRICGKSQYCSDFCTTWDMRYGGHASVCNAELQLRNLVDSIAFGEGDDNRNAKRTADEAVQERDDMITDIQTSQTRRVLRGRRRGQNAPTVPLGASMSAEESQKWINVLVSLTMSNAVMVRAGLYIKRDKFPVLFQAIEENERLLEALASQITLLSNQTNTETTVYKQIQQNIETTKRAIESNMKNAEDELESYKTRTEKDPKRTRTTKTVRVIPGQGQGTASKSLNDVVREQLRDKGIPNELVEWFSAPADPAWTDKQVLELRLVSGKPPAFDMREGETIKSFTVVKRADAIDQSLVSDSARQSITQQLPATAAESSAGIETALEIITKSGSAMSLAAGSAWAWAAQVVIAAATGTAAQVALLNNAVTLMMGGDWSDLDWSVVFELLAQGTIRTISDLRDAIIEKIDLSKVPRVPGVFFGLARPRKQDEGIEQGSYLAAILEALRSGLNTLWRVLGAVVNMLTAAVRFIGRGLVSIGHFMIDHPAISLALIGTAVAVYFIGPLTLAASVGNAFGSMAQLISSVFGSITTPVWNGFITLLRYTNFFFCTVGLGSSVFKVIVRRGLEKYTNVTGERTLAFISEVISYLMLYVVCGWTTGVIADAVPATDDTLPRRAITDGSNEPYALVPVSRPGQPDVMPRNPGTILQPGVEPIPGSDNGGTLVAVLSQSSNRSTALIQTMDGSIGLVNNATLAPAAVGSTALSESTGSTLAVWAPPVSSVAPLTIDRAYIDTPIDATALPNTGRTFVLSESKFYSLRARSVRRMRPVLPPTIEIASNEAQLIRNVAESATLTINADENTVLQDSIRLFENTGMMRSIALMGMTIAHAVKLPVV